MEKQELLKTIEDVIVMEAQIEPGLDYDKEIYSEKGVDLIDSIPIVMELEGRFEIAISDEDFSKANTVNEMADLVSKLIA